MVILIKRPRQDLCTEDTIIILTDIMCIQAWGLQDHGAEQVYTRSLVLIPIPGSSAPAASDVGLCPGTAGVLSSFIPACRGGE